MNPFQRIISLPAVSDNRVVAELQCSHAELSARIDQLNADVARAHSRLSSASQVRNSLQANSVDRVLLFARSRAVSALQAALPEFNRRPASLCEADTVVQVSIVSKETDCTLDEFKTLAAMLSSDASVRCSLYPSQYHVTFPSAQLTTRLGILFQSYTDICSALKMDACEREGPIYRERHTHGRKLRAVQVLGVAIKGDDYRQIHLGQSFPSVPSTVTVPILHQPSLVWSDRSWEKGFHFQNVPVPTMPRDAPIPATSGSRVRRRTSDVNTTPFNAFFSLQWERLSRKCILGSSTTAEVPGTMRSSFPAVVLRSQKLTSSAQKVFLTRVNGVLPKEIILSTGLNDRCAAPI